MNKLLLTAAIVLSPMLLRADAVLDTGKVTMGVFGNGGLGYNSVGLSLNGGPGDVITPGCLCEGWGAAANGTGNWVYAGSPSGFITVDFTLFGPSSAVSDVLLANGLRVLHTYSSAASGNLFRVNVRLTNVTGGELSNVRYARTLDWDVPPDHFDDDFTTIFGGTPAGPGGKVFHTSLDPFAEPNPMLTRDTFPNQNRTDEPGDMGGYFILSFGNLASGATHEFDTFIGAAESREALLAAFGSVGIEAYTYSIDNDGPPAFGWGFANVGLDPALPNPEVPEPGTWAMIVSGLGVLAMNRRLKA